MTTTITVVDSLGEPLREYFGVAELVALQPLADGEVALTDNPTPDTPSWWNGSAWVAKPAQPDPAHEWDPVAKQWHDPRSLQQLKDLKWASIKAAREAAEKGTFTWNGMVFDADKERISAAAQAALIAQSRGVEPVDTWTLADNSTVPLSGNDFADLHIALTLHISAVHARGRELRAAIYAATTLSQLEAITWTFP